MSLSFLLYRLHIVVTYTYTWYQCWFTADRTELLRAHGKVSWNTCQLLTNYDTNVPSKQPPMLTSVPTRALKLNNFRINQRTIVLWNWHFFLFFLFFFPPALLRAISSYWESGNIRPQWRSLVDVIKVRPDCSCSGSVLILNELGVTVAKGVQDAHSIAWYTKKYNVFDKSLTEMLTVANTGLQLIVLLDVGFIKDIRIYCGTQFAYLKCV